MWKLYVKRESNLILLRLAAHLADGQKLTRGLAIYLIGHKIRVCLSLFSTVLSASCSFPQEMRVMLQDPPAPPAEAGCTQRCSAPAQLQRCRGCRGCRGAAVRARDRHGSDTATPPDKTLSVGALSPGSDGCATQGPRQPHEREHWCGCCAPVTPTHQQGNMESVMGSLKEKLHIQTMKLILRRAGRI